MSKKVTTPSTNSPAADLATNNSSNWLTNPKTPLVLSVLTFIAYYLYSRVSLGFYQHDEISHYFQMKSFFSDPTGVMNNWSKPGYKLLYALPSMLGSQFMVLFNIAVAVFGCYLTYLTVKIFDIKAAAVGFILCATQPFWIEMGFRNYVDPLSGIFLIGSIYLFLKEKYLLGALVLSYAVMVRQEFLIMTFLAGFYLLLNKKWLPIISLATFPFIYALICLYIKNDFFWMLTEAKETSIVYNKLYPRQGFDHYFLMSSAIFGAAVVCFAVGLIFDWSVKTYQKTEQTIRNSHKIILLIVPALVYFLIHALFNMQSMTIGTATGGNLRYMTAISPILAVLAALGLFHISKKTSNYILIIILGLYVYFFQSFEHNNILFITGKDDENIQNNATFFAFLFAAIIWLVKTSYQNKTLAILALGVIISWASLKPYKLSPEDITVKKSVDFLIKNDLVENKKVYTNHPLANYFYDLEKYHKIPNQGTIDSTTINAPSGAIILWDSHYSFRPKTNEGIDPNNFTKEKFEYLFDQVSKDERFQTVIFEVK